MNLIEQETLKELRRLFADPASTARRYARYCTICCVAMIACAFAAGILHALTETDLAKMSLVLVAGILGGLAAYFCVASKQVTILARYCLLDDEAVRQQSKE